MLKNNLKYKQIKIAFTTYIEERIQKQLNKLLSAPKEDLPIIQGIVKELVAITKEVDRYIDDSEKELDAIYKNKLDNPQGTQKGI